MSPAVTDWTPSSVVNFALSVKGSTRLIRKSNVYSFRPSAFTVRSARASTSAPAEIWAVALSVYVPYMNENDPLNLFFWFAVLPPESGAPESFSAEELACILGTSSILAFTVTFVPATEPAPSPILAVSLFVENIRLTAAATSNGSGGELSPAFDDFPTMLVQRSERKPMTGVLTLSIAALLRSSR